jgi:hypothetical protein
MQYCLRGEVFRESTKEREFEKAMKVLRHRLKEIGADQIGVKRFAGPKAERMTIDQLLDFLEDDLEIRSKWTAQAKSKMQPLRTALGRMPAMSVTDSIIRDYIRVRLSGPEKVIAEMKRDSPSLVAAALMRIKRLRPVSNATVNRELEYLRQAFALKIHEIGPGPVMPRLKESAREGFFERAEFEIITVKLPEDLQDFSR